MTESKCTGVQRDKRRWERLDRAPDGIDVWIGGRRFTRIKIFINKAIRMDASGVTLLRQKLLKALRTRPGSRYHAFSVEDLVACTDYGISRGLARFDEKRGPLGYCLSIWVQKTLNEYIAREWKWAKRAGSVDTSAFPDLVEAWRDAEDAREVFTFFQEIQGEKSFPLIWKSLIEGKTLTELAEEAGITYGRIKRAYERELSVVRELLHISLDREELLDLRPK